MATLPRQPAHSLQAVLGGVLGCPPMVWAVLEAQTAFGGVRR
jgi:hypothetical protein